MTKLSEEQLAVLKQARIPFVAHNTKLTELGATGAAMHKYMVENYNADVLAGVGVMLVGSKYTAVDLVKLFQATARAAALVGTHVAYTSLQTLVDAVASDGHPAYGEFVSCANLFVGGFWDASIPCPLSNAERFRVEGFLRDRFEQGYANSYAMLDGGDADKWWSHSFMAEQQSRSKVVIV